MTRFDQLLAIASIVLFGLMVAVVNQNIEWLHDTCLLSVSVADA